MPKDFFICQYCGEKVNLEAIGTRNRNHCPFCLWSLHVDKKFPGNRGAFCQGLMEPVGLTFKDEGIDKYGKKRQGEIMLVHKCVKCGKISVNRLAGDDDPNKVLAVFANSFLNDFRPDAKLEGIELAEERDKGKVERQLFGEK